MVDWDRGFSTNSPEFLLLGEEEIEEFRSEKTVTASKSPEEIERLMVDEGLSPIERACLLLSTGQDVQKVYTVEQLPKLLEKHHDQALCKVLPKICDILPVSSSDIQLAAGKSFTVVATRQLVPPHIFTSSLLPTILQMVNCRDIAVSTVWVDALLAAIPALPKDIIRRDILSLAASRAQLSQSVSSRKSSCLIIGRMAEKFEPFWLKRELLPLASSLCQDVDHEVRATMCSRLTNLARPMGQELTKSSILPELTELASDEETVVRVAALETITDMISLLPQEVVTSSIIPLVQQFCTQALSSSHESLTAVARLLGKLSYELKDVMSAKLRDWFVQFYCKLSQYEEPVNETGSSSSISIATPTTGNGMGTECRRLCAYNFPAILLLAGASSFQPDLSQALLQLATDQSPHIRGTVAGGYHEVVRLLGNKCMCVASTYQTLLRDKSPEVLLSLAPHLPQTMKTFAAASNLAQDTMQPGLLDFIGPLLAAESTACSGLHWRLHEELITGFSSLVHCLTSDQLYTRFTPLLFRHITGNYVLPVKLACCRTLITFVRHNRKAEQRNAVCDRLIEECGKSSCCRTRLLFLDICDIVLAIFSRSFFKEHFFKAVLELGNDPVINVRLRLCSLLPSLKAVLKLPGDRVLLQELEQTVRQLLSQERDRDTIQAIRHAVTELDRIQVAMESLTRKTFFEADLIDQQKEEEERKLVEAEEREKEKEKEREGGNGGKKGVPASLGARCSPAVQKAQLGKKAAVRTTSLPGRSPNQSRRAGSVTSLTPPSPNLPGSSSPSALRKTFAASKSKGNCTPTPGRHLSPVIRADSLPLEVQRGEEGEEGKKSGNRSTPGSPRLAASSRVRTTGGSSRSASNSPNTTSKLGISKSKDQLDSRSGSASKRKPPPPNSSKTSKRT